MKRVGRVLFTLLSVSVLAQPVSQVQSRANPARTVQLDSPSAVRSRTPLYQRRDTWYQFLLKQFNSDDLDYGAWLEQHRQAFLDASVHNRYFNYSAGVTIALIVMTLLFAKQRMDHGRAMWITAEMMTDLYNHDTYSRQVAREAIDRYNDHIERCNRAIEAADHGLCVPEMDSNVGSLRSELQSVREERDSYKRERDLATQDLAVKERLLADVSLRLDALTKTSDPHGSPTNTLDIHSADPRLVEHINTCEEQLYAERREDRRLQGA
jgi:hypothetical protein